MFGVEDAGESPDADVPRCNVRQEYIWPISMHTYAEIINHKPVPIFFKSLSISYSHLYFLFFLFSISPLQAGSCRGHHQTFMVSLLCSTIAWIQISASGASMTPTDGWKAWEKAAVRQVPDTLGYAMPCNLNSSRRLVFLSLLVEQKIKTQEGEATSLQSQHQ